MSVLARAASAARTCYGPPNSLRRAVALAGRNVAALLAPYAILVYLLDVNAWLAWLLVGAAFAAWTACQRSQSQRRYRDRRIPQVPEEDLRLALQALQETTDEEAAPDMNEQTGPETTGKPVIHLDNTGTRGSALENYERTAQEAICQGYAVAPVPSDGNEHYVTPYRGRRGFTACPACSPAPEPGEATTGPTRD